MNQELDDIFGTAPVKGAQAKCLPPGVYENIPAAEYHALPYVSSSFLKKFKNNPAAALLPVDQTPAMILGSASHAYSLEGEAAFLAEYAVVPEIAPPADYTGQRWTATNEYKARVAAFNAANTGKTLLTREQFDVVLGLDKSLKSHPAAAILLRSGRQELTLIWDDPTTGLRCKARLDHSPGNRVLVDYKTTADVDKFRGKLIGLNYDLQASHYLTAAKACGIDVDTFVFVVGGTSAPHPVRCVSLFPEWMEWAQAEVSRLLHLVRQCRERNYFPNYEIPEEITDLDDLTPAHLLEMWELPKWRNQ